MQVAKYEEEIIMIRLFAGEKWQGKTSKLIAVANDHLNVTEGDIVFIEAGKRNMHSIHRKIRLVDTTEFPPSNYREFVSFIYGMLSQNNDISEVFIDSLSKIITNLDDADLVAMCAALKKISDDESVEFFMTLNCDPAALPAEVKPFAE